IRDATVTGVQTCALPISLWEVSANGTDLHPLLPGSHTECCGTWTPDGKYFVFLSFKDLTSQNLWAIRQKSTFFRKASGEAVQLKIGRASGRDRRDDGW